MTISNRALALFLSTVASFSCSNADAQTTSFPPSLPDASTLSVSWTAPVQPLGGSLMLNADYFHTDEFGAQVGRNLPGYDLVNARISLSEISGTGVSLALSAQNIFKERYFAAPSNLLSSFPTNTVYAGDRRSLTLEAKYRS